jgi:hypothetical protein
LGRNPAAPIIGRHQEDKSAGTPHVEVGMFVT